jgi:hypothetical protein
MKVYYKIQMRSDKKRVLKVPRVKTGYKGSRIQMASDFSAATLESERIKPFKIVGTKIIFHLEF